MALGGETNPKVAFQAETPMRQIFLLLSIFSAFVACTAIAPISPAHANNNREGTPCLKVGVFSDFGKTASGIILPVLSRMYKIADLCMEPIFLPAKRSALQLADGDLDAEMVRVATDRGEAQNYSLLVPQAIFRVDVQFTWLNSTDFSGTFTDLKGRSVGVLSGQRAALDRLKPYTNKIVPLHNLKSVAPLLERGRIDILLSDGIGLADLRKDYTSDKTQLRHKVFAHRLVYHVLHKRHADKAERLALALKIMLQSDELSYFSKEYGLYPAEIEN